MTAIFETVILIRLLKIMKGAIATRSHLAQLSHITFRATDDGVTMTGTDLDVELTLDVPNARMDCDAFTLSWADLQKFTASADKGGFVTITPMAEGDDVDTLGHAVELDGLTATLDGFKLDDMPALVAAELLPTSVVMPGPDLHAALDTVQHAISTEATRYYLNGVYMHATDQSRHNVAFVATDGHRLALVTTNQTTGKADPDNHWQMECILPTASVAVLLSAVNPKSDAPIVIQWGKTRATFAGDGFRLSTKIIDGTFPDYTRVIPRDTETRLSLDHAAVKKQVSRMIKLGAESLELLPDAGEIRACDRDNPNQRFSFTHDFAATGTDVEPFRVTAKYVLDSMAAAVALGGGVHIEKSRSAGDPMLMLPANAGQFNDARFVIMPRRF